MKLDINQSNWNTVLSSILKTYKPSQKMVQRYQNTKFHLSGDRIITLGDCSKASYHTTTDPEMIKKEVKYGINWTDVSDMESNIDDLGNSKKEYGLTACYCYIKLLDENELLDLLEKDKEAPADIKDQLFKDSFKRVNRYSAVLMRSKNKII
jgi:hypothetical protein